MNYCRIDLDKTKYSLVSNFIIYVDPPLGQLQDIYVAYCRHKQFESVMPLFESQFTDPRNDIFGYYDKTGRMVAFSIVRRHDDQNAESLQFAWDYQDPGLRLGIKSLQHECAYYKMQGYKYLYLGQVDSYKQQLDGYQQLGKI